MLEAAIYFDFSIPLKLLLIEMRLPHHYLMESVKQRKTRSPSPILYIKEWFLFSTKKTSRALISSFVRVHKKAGEIVEAI